MNEPIMMFPYSPDQLRKLISETVKEALTATPEKPKEVYLTRAEAAERLKISIPTLNRWSKIGSLKSYIVGGRVFYKESELDKGFQEVQTVKY